MKKHSRVNPGARIRNTKSSTVSKNLWFSQKEYDSPYHYNSIYEVLDELTMDGYTAFQIEHIIRLGWEEYKNGRR